MAATATATRPTTETREIREARQKVERAQRNLNGIVGKMATAYADLVRLEGELKTLLDRQGDNGS